jgi:hypothetical protein
VDDEERELEAILGALGGTRHVYLVCATQVSGEYWANHLGLRYRGPKVNCTILKTNDPYTIVGKLRGRRIERGDVVYHTGERERLGGGRNMVEAELRRAGWRGAYAKVLDDRGYI